MATTASSSTEKLVLHQFERGYNCPNASPFPTKLETYLRINKIPYESDFERPMGPKGKSPWITYQGKEIADSQLCIEFLNEKLNINMNSHLDKEQRAIAKAFRHMLEDNLYWFIVHERWVRSQGQIVYKVMPFPTGIKGYLMMKFVMNSMKNQCSAQGTGRHTFGEIEKMLNDTLTAILDFLGDKKYLMGDKICEEDCSVFGFLIQILYNSVDNEDRLKRVLEAHPNLKEYCERIRAEYWPDWDECLSKK